VKTFREEDAAAAWLEEDVKKARIEPAPMDAADRRLEPR
jgi:hypothetical protein